MTQEKRSLRVVRPAALMSLVATGSLLLAGCSAFSGGSQSGSAGGSSGPDKHPLQIEDASYPSEGVAVEGLHGQRIASSANIAARWDDLPGQRKFNKTVSKAVSKQVKAYAKSVGEKYVPEAHGVDSGMAERGCISGSTFMNPEEILQSPDLTPPSEGPGLTITCEPVVAAGTTFGERLRYVEGSADEVTSDTVQTFYTDTASGDVAREQDLLNSDTLSDIYTEAAPLVAERLGVPEELLLPASEGAQLLRDNVSAVQFNDEGAITITVDRAFSTKQLDAIDHAMDDEEDPTIDVLELPEPTAFSLYVVSERVPDFFTDLGVSIAKAHEEKLEWAGAEKFLAGEAYVNCTLTPCVALTFDDGPSELTPQLLRDLASENAAATFYLVGSNAEHYPEIVKEIAESGNELGNHSLSHPPLTTLSAEGVAEELGTTNDLVEAASGVVPSTVRPPYGDWNESVLATAGVPFIMWSIDTLDWEKPGSAALIDSAVHQSVPGDIILMHDIHEETTATVPDILAGLNDRGYTMATIEQMLGKKRLSEPTVIYSR